MERILDEIHRFICEYLDINSPVLLGLSGGVDSLALFEGLCKYKKQSFAVAHIDHGWRYESSEEAQKLKEYVESRNIRFHLKRLDPKVMHGNLEDASRNCRYSFFSELCEKYGYQGVMTAHHAQDQAETVLKRVLEGANLMSLSGIQPVRTIHGVNVFRPLLNLEKQQLRQAISNLRFSSIEDSTNSDPTFLRARMRTEIIPYLEKQYGKNVSSNLSLLSKRIDEVNGYLDLQVAKYLSDHESGVMGHYLDLQGKLPMHHLELNHLLKNYFSRHNITVSRREMDTLIALLLKNHANKRVQSLYIDRGILFVPDENLTSASETCSKWKVTFSKGVCEKTYSWRECWKGTAEVSLPKGEYTIGPVKLNAPYKGKSSITKWWSNHKVPAFLKEYVPVIWEGDTIVHEFLTGVANRSGNTLIRLEHINIHQNC